MKERRDRCRRRRSNKAGPGMTVATLLAWQVGWMTPSASNAFTSSGNCRWQPSPTCVESLSWERHCNNRQSPATSSTTALGVWHFGGSLSEHKTHDYNVHDSCELVGVRIERTSANSRRIFGEIIVPVPVQDVWAILTDYDRLATHVPNLVESRIQERLNGGQPGDGSFQFRLYQKGSQKIVGFEFGASVTMNMQEQIISSAPPSSPSDNAGVAAPALLNANGVSHHDERLIKFKCYDSFFFQNFDGEWRAKEQVNNDNGAEETLLSYTVDVRPKGPVPVTALEWRIREDVPTNLRAIKRAATTRSAAVSNDTESWRRRQQQQTAAMTRARAPGGALARKLPPTSWDRDETMEAYLQD